MFSTSLAYSKSGTTLFGLNYYYKNSSSCSTGASGNNGQVQCISDSVDNGRTVAYTYDPLGRLSTALTNGSSGYPQWGLSWTYDRYGNRPAQTATAGSGLPQPNVTVDPATNRITGTGYAYDASGNATNDGFNTLVYDAENHAVSVSNTGASAAYSYDANGLRVKKAVTSGATTVYIFSGSKVIAEYDNGAAVGSPSREYIYSGGTLLAKIESSATVYYHQDGLSARIMTDSSGNVVTQQGHYPYGELWYQSGTGTKWTFTTYERDAESTNDYAMARYYRDALGRFNSPDPLSGSTSDPQSLNRYSYSRNEPIDLVDPSGMTPSGSGGGTSQNCTLNITVKNEASLSSADLNQAENQISAIFGQTSDPQGNTVGINFTSGQGDFTLNFTTAPWYVLSSRAGHTGCLPFYGCNFESDVYVDNINNWFNEPPGASFIGAVGAHELWHAITDTWFDNCNDPHNLSCGTGVNGDPPGAYNALTPQQIADIFKKCLKLHPVHPQGMPDAATRFYYQIGITYVMMARMGFGGSMETSWDRMNALADFASTMPSVQVESVTHTILPGNSSGKY